MGGKVLAFSKVIGTVIVYLVLAIASEFLLLYLPNVSWTPFLFLQILPLAILIFGSYRVFKRVGLMFLDNPRVKVYCWTFAILSFVLCALAFIPLTIYAILWISDLQGQGLVYLRLPTSLL